MKKYFQAAALAACLLATTAVQAATYNFSYTFTTGEAITGSFDGTANGNLITGLSNISLALNGLDFPGAISSYSYVTDTGEWLSGSAVASLDGTQNNFYFLNGDPNEVTVTHGFMFIPYASYSTDYALAIHPTGNPEDYSPDGAILANWRVTAVPEPETYAMLLAGIALVGVAARRRQRANVG